MGFSNHWKNGCAWLFVLCLSVSSLEAATCYASPDGRSRDASNDQIDIELSGTWQVQKVSDLIYPPTNAWQETTVPGTLNGFQYERAWFRKSFVLTQAVECTALKLQFGGVKFNSQVWLNGTYVGGCFNGYDPFELDVTAAILIGATNELLVGVYDWTGVFAYSVNLDNPDYAGGVRNMAVNALLAPIGGEFACYGIWQPVKLVGIPAVSVQELFILPSVRNSNLVLRLLLTNAGAPACSVMMSNQVLDAGMPVLAFPATAITIPGGGATNLEVSVSWTNAHRWSHEDPYLYELETTLINSDGSTDHRTTRFGFREFRVQTNQFYLNDIPIHLLATSFWPPQTNLTKDVMRTVIQTIKAGNNNALRFHAQPWDEQWYDVADEEGLLIVEEAAVWCDSYSYRWSDPVFWTNYNRHLTAMVKRDWNHPSVVMWSLENEVVTGGSELACPGMTNQLAVQGLMVKALDPTRPIIFESDDDPAGVADVIGIHYPHEFPSFHLWPNTAYWLDEEGGLFMGTNGTWTWSRAKPLHIGEFLYTDQAVEDYTILFGDAAYGSLRRSRMWAKAELWRMQTEAFRACGVNGMCPWTIFENSLLASRKDYELDPDNNVLYQAQKAAYHPNAVFAQEYNTRFFAGENVQRHVNVFNDRLTSGDFLLTWSVDGVSESNRSFAMTPASCHSEALSFTAPSGGGAFELALELTRDGAVVFTNRILYQSVVREALSLPQDCTLGVYDPQGTAIDLLSQAGIPFLTITDLKNVQYAQLDLLLVGDGAFTDDAGGEVGTNGIKSLWQDFMFRGGWVVVLEQSTYPYWMPFGLQVTNYPSTYAFANPDHPIMDQISSDDMRWWADDHLVVRNALISPSRGKIRNLSPVGSAQGLAYSAAVECSFGLGGMICAQWLLTERLDVEPLAGVLLQRILDYCADTAAHQETCSVGLLAETNAVASVRLAELGLTAVNLCGRVAGTDLMQMPVILIAGNASAWQEAVEQLPRLTDYVEAGGKLVLHRPTAAFLEAAQTTLLSQVLPVDVAQVPVQCRERSNAVVHLTNNDLYWIKTAGNGSASSEVLSTNVACRSYRERYGLSTYETIQVEDMPVRTVGWNSSGMWVLPSEGYVQQDIAVALAGVYEFDLLARGTPALGVWPKASLLVDGEPRDCVCVMGTNPVSYFLYAELSTGIHSLAVSFDNDCYAAPEDRNLYLDEIRWGACTGQAVSVLTSPGAVVQVQYGDGVVLVDEILWEQELKDRVKADRYISTLLTGLGVSMLDPAKLTVEAETMTIISGACVPAAGWMWIMSMGRIEIPMEFTSSGNYLFTVEASGTPALGTNPLMCVVLDNVTQKTYSVSTESFNPYSDVYYVASGVHTVALAFINDWYALPEDRNLYVDRLTVTPQRSPYDQWRVERFTPEELLSPAVGGAEADPDGDGVGNESEYAADTDPKSDASVLRVQTIESQSGGIALRWQGGIAADQLLQTCSNLHTGDWITLFTNTPPTATGSTYLDPSSTATTRYYRVKAWRE